LKPPGKDIQMKNNLRIPDIITIGNLIAGFTGILYIINGETAIATKLVMLAVILDGLDGTTARLLYKNRPSKLGAQLDSLADATSFGVLPATIIYVAIPTPIAIPLSAIFLTTAILRLARFNLNPSQNNFQGLPTTCAGLIIAVYTIHIQALIPTIIVVIALSLLMISKIRYPKITTKQRLLIAPLLIAAIITTGTIFTVTTILILFLITAYILIGPLANTKIKTTTTGQTER